MPETSAPHYLCMKTIHFHKQSIAINKKQLILLKDSQTTQGRDFNKDNILTMYLKDHI